MHVHINSGDGEAKFWIEPEIELANNYGFSREKLKQIEKIIEEKTDEIKDSWKKHFIG